MQCSELCLHRHRRREAVQVHLVGVLALGFDKQRVVIAVGEGNELGLNRRTITWAGALNLAVVKGRIGEIRP